MDDLEGLECSEHAKNIRNRKISFFYRIRKIFSQLRFKIFFELDKNISPIFGGFWVLVRAWETETHISVGRVFRAAKGVRFQFTRAKRGFEAKSGFQFTRAKRGLEAKLGFQFTRAKGGFGAKTRFQFTHPKRVREISVYLVEITFK